MKFLIFNLIVGAALIYLFGSDGQRFQTLPEKAHAASDIITSKIASLTRTPEKLPEKKGQSHPVRAAERSPAISLTETKPKAGSGLELAETKPVELEPAIFERRKEIMATTPQSPPDAAAQGKGLMSRQDRQKALLQLAEEMELFSAKAMSR